MLWRPWALRRGEAGISARVGPGPIGEPSVRPALPVHYSAHVIRAPDHADELNAGSEHSQVIIASGSGATSVDGATHLGA